MKKVKVNGTEWDCAIVVASGSEDAFVALHMADTDVYARKADKEQALRLTYKQSAEAMGVKPAKAAVKPVKPTVPEEKE